MKIETKIIFLSFTIGMFVWLFDIILDTYFYKIIYGSFWEGVFSIHDLYMRILILFFFLAFGLIISKLIKKQKNIEKQVIDAYHFQQILINSIPVPVFYKDVDLVYRGCNKSFEDFIGMDRKNIVGKSVYDIAPVELADKYHKKNLFYFGKSGIWA